MTVKDIKARLEAEIERLEKCEHGIATKRDYRIGVFNGMAEAYKTMISENDIKDFDAMYKEMLEIYF